MLVCESSLHIFLAACFINHDNDQRPCHTCLTISLLYIYIIFHYLSLAALITLSITDMQLLMLLNHLNMLS